MVAGWIKKIAVKKGKEYVKNWIKEHIVLVVSVVLLLFIILIFAMKGIFFDPFRRRRRNYFRFKRYVRSKEGNSFVEKVAKENVDKKLDKKARESARKIAEREIRNTMQRMHGAGVCHGLFPNPREWLESYRCWRRLKEEWDREGYRSFPAAVKWFPGDLNLPFARGILRGKAKAEIERNFEPIMKAVDTLEKQ